MDEKVLIVKYGEVAIRKNNQHIFISRLVSSIRRNLDDLGEFYVVKEHCNVISLNNMALEMTRTFLLFKKNR